jgi:hypothetical protein
MLKHLLPLLLPLSSILSASEFKVGKIAFSLDDKPFQIRSGEIHYSRVPRAEWRSRIQMAKSMGLNTISTYVFWNYHETQAGKFDFKGEKDVMDFVRLCGAEEMKVIVRPGPYVCAEWDLGGLPAWLLKEPGIKLRSSDGRFLEPARNWMRRMGSMLKPLAVSRGGPVIMVQLENEFGSFGVPDSGYLTPFTHLARAPLRTTSAPPMCFRIRRANACSSREPPSRCSPMDRPSISTDSRIRSPGRKLFSGIARTRISPCLKPGASHFMPKNPSVFPRMSICSARSAPKTASMARLSSSRASPLSPGKNTFHSPGPLS